VIATHILHHKAETGSFSAIATFFNVTKGTAKQHWTCSLSGLLPRGGQSIFSEVIKSQGFHYVAEKFTQLQPVRYDTISNMNTS
jgi:hypothetical protein